MYKKKLIILFLLLAPMYQITADIYIPSLPFIQADLKTSTTNTQLSLTLFLSGASIAQIFYGNLSDFIGTKTLLIFGLILTAISSIICANTTNIIIFNINKLLQGIGVTSITLYRVILFSNFNNHELNKIFSKLSAMTIVALASAPLIGSFLHNHFNWGSTFVFITIYSLITLIYLINILPPQKKIPISINAIKNNNILITKNKTFTTYSCLVLFCYFSIISWISSSAYILQQSYSLSILQCGYVLLYCGFIAAITNLINAKINYKKNQLIYFGICCILTSGILILILKLTNTISLKTLIFNISFLMIGIGFIFPNCYQLALNSVKSKLGTANSLIATFQSTGGIISSFIIAKLKLNYTLELSMLLIFASICMLLIYKTKCLKLGFS